MTNKHRHGFGLGCVIVELCRDELFEEGNRQVRETCRGKTARLQPYASSPITAGRRSVPRTLTAGIVYSPVAVTPPPATEQRELRILERRSSSNRERASGTPPTDVPEKSSGRSDTTARLQETRSSNRVRESDGRPCECDRPGSQSCEDHDEDGQNPRSARTTEQVGDPSSNDLSEESSEELLVKRNSTIRNGRHSMGVKLGNYDENACLQSFLARFKNCAEYFEWDDSDKLFQLRASLVGSAGQILWDAGKKVEVNRIVALLKARFDSENQAERFRAELQSRKRSKGESLQKLYPDVCRLISLAYPRESSALSDIVGRDAFLEALDDQALRVRILEKEPKNLDDALNLASRLEAFDIMGSTGPETDKNKPKMLADLKKWCALIDEIWTSSSRRLKV